jgi:hypothetical protein
VVSWPGFLLRKKGSRKKLARPRGMDPLANHGISSFSFRGFVCGTAILFYQCSMKRACLAILSLVQSFYAGKSLKKIRFILSLEFEKNIEAIFKLLNAQAIEALLFLKPD